MEENVKVLKLNTMSLQMMQWSSKSIEKLTQILTISIWVILLWKRTLSFLWHTHCTASHFPKSVWTLFHLQNVQCKWHYFSSTFFWIRSFCFLTNYKWHNLGPFFLSCFSRSSKRIQTIHSYFSAIHFSFVVKAHVWLQH